MSHTSQNPLSRAATPPTQATVAREGLLLSPSWGSTASLTSSRASSRPPSRAATAAGGGGGGSNNAPSSWPAIHDHGPYGHAVGLGSPSPRNEMDVRFGVYKVPASASTLSRRSQICSAYGGALPTGHGPSTTDVHSARRLVHEILSARGAHRKALRSSTRKCMRTLGASASLESLSRPLDLVGTMRWYDAMSNYPKMIFELEGAAERHRLQAEAANNSKSPTRRSPARGATRGASSTAAATRRPASREYSAVDDARWYDDSMVWAGGGPYRSGTGL